MNLKNICQKISPRIAIFVAVIVAISSSHSDAATTDSAVNKAATHYQIGSMYVDQYSNANAKGAPIILIPGLGSGAYVWDNTVKQLQDEHNLYVITLAGFNGKPALAGAKLEKARQSLLELITTKKIDKPILVGHSLGATLSTWFAQEHSNKIRAVFAVEGLPIFPRTENVPADQRAMMAEGLKNQMAGVTQEVFVAQQLQYMQTIGVIDPDLAKTLAERSATSDKDAVADYMSELIAMDIRKDLPAITVPLAIVSPYYAKDMAPMNVSEEQKAAYYGSLLAGTPKLQVISIKDARHFPMLDQTKEFAEKLATFVRSVQ